jgi:branched-subunit amino acid permease
MKKFISKQKNLLIALSSLVIICEILLKINNRIIQSIGIILTPIIALLVFLVIRNDQKDLEN